MKIVHLTNNTFDGAGQVACVLHKSLKDVGEDSLMLVYRKTDNDESVVQVCDGHPVHSVADLLRENFKFLKFVIKKIRWKFMPYPMKGFLCQK